MPGETAGPGQEAYGLSTEEYSREISPETYKELNEVMLSAPDILKMFTGDKDYRTEQKTKFWAGEIENPTLDYPKIDLEQLTQREQRLLMLKADFKGKDPRIAKVMNEAWKDDEPLTPDLVNRVAIVWKINEAIAVMRMMKLVKEADALNPDTTPEQKQTALRKYQRYQEFIYGKPDHAVSALVVNRARDEVERWAKSDNPELRAQAEKLAGMFPERQPEPQEYEWPEEKTKEFWKEVTDETVGEYVEEVKKRAPYLVELPPDTVLTPTQVQQSFQAGIDVIKAEGWEVLIDPDVGGISINAIDKKIRVPDIARTKAYRMLPLVVHEVFWHLGRSEAGEQTALVYSKLGPLPRIGYDRYLSGEEGLAYAKEEFFDTSMRYDTNMYIASGLALGEYGKPRSFRETYEVMYQNGVCLNLWRGDTLEKSQNLAKQSAWDLCVRIFRGFPGDKTYAEGETKGQASLGSLYYESGYLQNYNFIKKMGTHPNGKRLIKFITAWGKTDPAKARHLWIMKRGGATDTVLEDLELAA